MTKPRFSIVIPTRQRHRTLSSAIQSVLGQPYEDFELIVQDNFSSEETWKTVRGFNSPKLRYNRAPYLLPMNENWEQALDLCQGEYVLFIGDDDGMMPDGMALASSILERQPMDVLMWEKYTYWWEDALEPTLAGRMFLHLTHGFRMADPAAILQGYYDWRLGFGALPSVYTGFVRRTLIDRVKSKIGKYFYVGAPDNFTGIANAYFAESVGVFDRALSMCGNSGQSTGCSYFFRSRGQERRNAYHSEEGKSIAEIIHPSLIPSVNLEVNQADMQLRAKELLFPGDDRYRVDMATVLRGMAANINRDPASYDDTLTEIRALAAKHGIATATIALPPKASGERTSFQGMMTDASGKPQTLAVNCREAGVHDVASAVRLASALLPSLTIN